MLFNRRLLMFLAFLLLFTVSFPAVSSAHITNHSLTASSAYAYDPCPYESTPTITEPSLYQERCIRENFFQDQKSTRAAHLLRAEQHWAERIFSGEFASGFTVATKSEGLFKEFGITPGKGINLNIPSAPGGKSYIIYAFKDSSGKIVYVGRASGTGTPLQVLRQRISKGHEHFHEGLTPFVVDVQKSKLASQGAEEFFIQAYREQGANLTNIDEALSFSNKQRQQKSISKIDAFFEELFGR